MTRVCPLALSVLVCLLQGRRCEYLETSPVFLTVSSLYRNHPYESSFIDREIQIHWNDDVDSIAFYLEDPLSSPTPALEFLTDPSLNGFMQTNISLDNAVLPGEWMEASSKSPTPGDHCLPFWVVGFSQGSLLHAECLKIRPTWMQDNRLAIGSLDLASVFIPGTHNSACYKRGESLSLKDAAGRYLMTQDQDIWSQLVYGIRYFDIRVGFYAFVRNESEFVETDQGFWVNHDLIKIRPLLPIIETFKKFLEKSRDEIIFLDFHRFPVGFSNGPSRHRRLVDLLYRELKQYAIPYQYPFPTLEYIWSTPYRLIISYGEKTIVKDNEWLWPGVSQMWGNQQTGAKLYEYLNGYMTGETADMDGKIWAAMAHLTPAPLEILFNPKTNLRNLAHSISSNLTDWFKDEWWDKTNIVASDFFLETDLVNVAVAANIKKGNRPIKYIVG